MKAAKFDLQIAATLAAAGDELVARGFDSKVVAGSQSLGPMLNLRLVRPTQLIDISGLSELRGVTTDHQTIRIGAGVTHAEIEDGIYPALLNHPWKKVAANIAYRSVRNRGTIGGSLAHADPAADWVLAATAMNADIDIVSVDPNDGALAIRTAPMQKFMIAAYTTVLEPHDIIHSISLPLSSAHAKWGYYKFCRKVGEFAHASCAVYINDVDRCANIAIGALDGPPKLLPELASKIIDSGWSAMPGSLQNEAVVKAVSAAIPERDPIDQKMYTTAVIRALNKAFNSGAVDD
ncbi:FAD binding domain-containing protein [Orrella daihaiensis]|uniref:FAD binding domain-containing protein n=1 Tax=Orrella daihaiensis TaxID=2782176 RepID=A0ABY4AM17_9BURK|nr:FAD binding domain-containing protein [Orrella daihaiensis]UOD50122.1 FAD binding domain-containing protein [Orrella daihaiensis]